RADARSSGVPPSATTLGLCCCPSAVNVKSSSTLASSEWIFIVILLLFCFLRWSAILARVAAACVDCHPMIAFHTLGEGEDSWGHTVGGTRAINGEVPVTCVGSFCSKTCAWRETGTGK